MNLQKVCYYYGFYREDFENEQSMKKLNFYLNCIIKKSVSEEILRLIKNKPMTTKEIREHFRFNSSFIHKSNKEISEDLNFMVKENYGNEIRMVKLGRKFPYILYKPLKAEYREMFSDGGGMEMVKISDPKKETTEEMIRRIYPDYVIIEK